MPLLLLGDQTVLLLHVLRALGWILTIEQPTQTLIYPHHNATRGKYEDEFGLLVVGNC
jgi:hypothetical protein